MESQVERHLLRTNGKAPWDMGTAFQCAPSPGDHGCDGGYKLGAADTTLSSGAETWLQTWLRTLALAPRAESSEETLRPWVSACTTKLVLVVPEATSHAQDTLLTFSCLGQGQDLRLATIKTWHGAWQGWPWSEGPELRKLI